MAHYSEDMGCFNHLSKPALTEKMAEYFFRNKSLRINECGYDLTVFKSGIKVFDNYVTWDGDERWPYQSPEYWEHFEADEKEAEAARIEMTEIESTAYTLAEEKIRLAKEKEAADKQQKQEKEQAAFDAAQRKEYEKLRQKFGN